MPYISLHEIRGHSGTLQTTTHYNPFFDGREIRRVRSQDPEELLPILAQLIATASYSSPIESEDFRQHVLVTFDKIGTMAPNGPRAW